MYVCMCGRGLRDLEGFILYDTTCTIIISCHQFLMHIIFTNANTSMYHHRYYTPFPGLETRLPPHIIAMQITWLYACVGSLAVPKELAKSWTFAS